MDEREAKQYIISRVRVTPQQVVIAKGLIFQLVRDSSRTETLVAAVLQAHNVEPPQKVVLHPSADPVSQLNRVAETITWRVAAAEAVWSLIHSGFLLPLSNRLSGNASSP